MTTNRASELGPGNQVISCPWYPYEVGGGHAMLGPPWLVLQFHGTGDYAHLEDIMSQARHLKPDEIVVITALCHAEKSNK